MEASERELLEGRPHLVRLLEAVAGIMGLEDARLELVFEHGKLSRWFSHSERRQPRDMGEYDDRAAYLTSSPRDETAQ